MEQAWRRLGIDLLAQSQSRFRQVMHLLEVQPKLSTSAKKRASLKAVSGVTVRLPRTISPIRVAGTRMLIASWLWLIPRGSKNSLANISPGEVVTYLKFQPFAGRTSGTSFSAFSLVAITYALYLLRRV